MATTMPSMPNNVFFIIRLKMSQNINASSCGLVCHHGISDDVYPIGGLVEPDEILMASAIRHCRHLAIWRTTVSSPTTDCI
jgi:hypothetical protein